MHPRARQWGRGASSGWRRGLFRSGMIPNPDVEIKILQRQEAGTDVGRWLSSQN